MTVTKEPLRFGLTSLRHSACDLFGVYRPIPDNDPNREAIQKNVPVVKMFIGTGS